MLGILRAMAVGRALKKYKVHVVRSRGTSVTSNRVRRSVARHRSRLRPSVINDELKMYIAAQRAGRLGEYEDRRRWAPVHDVRSPKGVIALSHRLKEVLVRKKGKSEVRKIGFINPARVIICARRRMRREVIHAIKRSGAGGGYRYKKPKWNENSAIVCYGG